MCNPGLPSPYPDPLAQPLPNTLSQAPYPALLAQALPSFLSPVQGLMASGSAWAQVGSQCSAASSVLQNLAR